MDGVKVNDDTGSPYAYNWTMTTGNHTLQARAVDDRGAVTSGGTATVHAPVDGTTALTRQYFYNAYQELCGVDEPETGVTLMGYDGAGNLAWSASGLPAGTACSSTGNTTAINARKAARTYDARNRISTLSFPDLNGNQSWSYTPDGLPASVTTYNDAGASSVINSYLYNKRRMPVSETQQVDSLTSSVGYGYDVNGHLSTLTYPDSLSVAYAPNALGQPTQAGTYATGVTYYPNGAIAGFTYGNGIVHALTQNARGLPDRSQDMDGITSVHDDSYDYDQVGNVLAISDAVSGNRGDRDMVYDNLNRLTSATSPMFGTATYTYDVVDNLRHVQVTGGTQVRNQDYVYDQYNRLTNITSGGATVVGLGYDVQGNLANKSGINYTFDYGNRLRAGGPETYRYDVQGRRARSSRSAGLVYSLYAKSGQLLFQRDERSGKRRQYVYLGRSLVAESDVPLAGGSATVSYQHTDALGSPVAVTNNARTVLQRSEYEPYGYLLNRPMEDGPGYTGHVTDAATGLVYMQQRYYDPLIGQQFLSVDPVTAVSPGGTFNRYWYGAANPYRFTDPDGRANLQYLDPMVAQDQAMYAAADGFNPKGWFAATGHAGALGFRNDADGYNLSEPRVSAHQFISDAKQNGLRVGQPIILAGCGLGGNYASSVASSNNSQVIATKAYVMFPVTQSDDNRRPYQPGSPIKLTANTDQFGNGKQATFTLYGADGVAIRSDIISITVNPKTGAISFEYEKQADSSNKTDEALQ